MANIYIEGGIYSNLNQALPNGRTNIGSKRISDSFNPITDLEDSDIPTKFVNAVEIDWNGAIVQTSYTGNSHTIIDSTGDLLQYIQGKVGENDIVELLYHCYGNYVLQKIIKVTKDHSILGMIYKTIMKNQNSLYKLSYGKKIMKEISSAYTLK